MKYIFRYLIALIGLAFPLFAIPGNKGCYAALTVPKFDSMPCNYDTCETDIHLFVEADTWCTERFFVTFSVSIHYKTATNELQHIKKQWKYDLTSTGQVSKNESVLLGKGDTLFDVVVASRKCECSSG